jgi:GNAT superfamily N-acetyltransferase
MDYKLEFVISKDIYEFGVVLPNLSSNFGISFYDAILMWCNVIKTPPIDKDDFWEVYLIKSNNDTVGICGLYRLNNPKELWLGWFGIIPSYRKLGYGKKSLDFMKGKAKEIGCNKILSYVDKNGESLEFYFKNGFKLIGTVKEYLKRHPEIDEDNFGSLEDFVIEFEIK